MDEITLKFFARLREETGVEQLSIGTAKVKNTNELLPFLMIEYPHWSEFLQKNLMVAVNQQMVTGNALLQAGDEVALFPPVTGG